MEQSERKLIVKYNGHIVGYLAELKDCEIAFQYADEWLKNGFSISPFSLPLQDRIFISKKSFFDGLYGVFWDSLPDGWGELLVRRMFTKLGLNYDNLSPLQKLSLISQRGLGALEYEPSQALKVISKDYDLDHLSKISNKIYNDEASSDLDSIYFVGASSGGARPKAHLLIDNEEWIIKFPCRIDPKDIGIKEYKMNELAYLCNLKVNEFKLFPSSICSGYFGTKRFDRQNGKKVHMISLCALLETTHRIPNLDYGHLFQVIKNICANQDDLYEAFRRMCFNVFANNKDDHGKNFSFLYDESIKGYKLSPAYDLTQTKSKFEHEMTVNGNGNPTEEDLLCLAANFNLSIDTCKEILNSIKQKCQSCEIK